MHPADILALLIKAGHPPAKIARDRSVYPSAVSAVIHGNSTSFPIASHIANVTNCDINILWPGRYTNPGQVGRKAV